MHQVQVRPPCSFPGVSFVIKKTAAEKISTAVWSKA